MQAKRLLEQAGLRRELGARAREIVLRGKDWKILAHRYVNIYDSAIRNFGL
jgi:hypothetical protein